jgi:RNA polymerase sigma-70 factor (ECF subfamily)
VDADREHLQGRIAAGYQTARTAWPRLAWDQGAFTFHVTRQLCGDECLTLDEVERLNFADLFLAGLCATQDSAAIEVFAAEILNPVCRSLVRLGLGDTEIDEVRQRLLVELLTPTGAEPPRIATFAGRGALRGWVRISAVRLANKLRRARERDSPSGDLVDGFAEHTADAELEYFKQLYRDEFKLAFAEAVSRLTRRQRNLLRHAVLDGLSVAKIGRIYHVSRATAARQLADARRLVIDNTREALRRRLALDSGEMQSVLRLIQSEFNLSVARILAACSKPSLP